MVNALAVVLPGEPGHRQLCAVAFAALGGSTAADSAALLDLNESVHDPRAGRPPGVAVRTAATGQPNSDLVVAWAHAGAFAHDRGRVVVVV